ncbi:MAG: sugar phosphate isomerase/epimerase family protein [Planctomycetota bacterium]|nr:sugar phosphate isomerase/epimerase family protein [Planctomycetota bacterium]
MQFGINMLLWTTHVTTDHEAQLAFAKECGFDGVEIPTFEGDTTHFGQLASVLDRLGLERTSSTGLDPEYDPISPDAAVRRAAVDRLRWAVDCAHAVGSAVLCGPLHSAFKVFRGRGPTEDEMRYSADVLREVAEHADAAGVMLAPEALNRFECYLVNTSSQLRALCDLVDHPKVRAHYDTHHMHLEDNDAGSAVATCAPVLGHVHLSENHRGVPGRGQVDWDGTFSALRAAGYDGWCVIESFSRLDPEFAAAIHVWRDYFVKPEDVCTEGLRFVRAGLVD